MSYRNLAATGVFALLMSSGAVMADTWRYAFEEALEEVQGKFAQKFKEEVEANSDHSVQLFPFGTLGESDSILEQTQSGILQFVDQSPGFTGALIPEAQVFFVPYLLPQDEETLATFFEEAFDDDHHADRGAAPAFRGYGSFRRGAVSRDRR